MALSSGIGGNRCEPEQRRRVRGAAIAWLLRWCLLGAAVVACGTPAPVPANLPATPLLWRATDAARGTGAIYLFGSVHVGRPDSLALGPAIRRAYESAEELVVEIDLSTLTPSEMVARAFEYVMLPPGETLRDRISPATFAALEERLRESQLSIEAVERLKPWAVTTMLAMAQFSEAGLEEEYGVDRYFIARAAGERPIRGLETLESQWKVFDSLAPEVQEMMLADTLARMDEDAGALIDAWVRGDEAALTRILFEPLEMAPQYAPFYEAVFFARNESMTDKLVSLSGDGKDRFVVLGTGHMLGPRGIPALLAARGFRVERVSGR